MSKKTIIASQALALAAAGKLSIQSATVSAEDMDLTSSSKLGENSQIEQDENYVPHMRMDQICSPLDVCMSPTDDFTNDFDNGEFSGGKFGSTDTTMPADGSDPSMGMDGGMDSGSKTAVDGPSQTPQYFASNGVIYTGDIDDFGEGGPRPKIDFIISNVPNKTMDMFLLYSDRPFGKKEPGMFDGAPGEAMPEDEGVRGMFDNPMGSGDLGIPVLDPATGGLESDLKFITGVRAMPMKPVPGFDANNDGQFDLPSPMGKLPTKLRTVVISVNLDKLGGMVADGQIPHNIFFQMAAFPVGEDGAPNIDFSKALYSDVDQFIIEIPGDEGEGDTGTKGGATSSNIDSSTGSKTTSTSTDGSSGSSGSKNSSGTDTSGTSPATDPNAGGTTDTSGSKTTG